MADNINTGGMQTKQKIMMAAVVVIFLIIAWQLKSMLFGGGAAPAAPTPSANVAANAATTNTTNTSPAAPGGAKAVPVPARDVAMTEGEKRLLALQMQTEAKYIAAMNELQLLRVQSEIAKNSKDIAQNRLDAVTAQKQTLQLLSAPQVSSSSYAQGLAGGGNPPPQAAPVAAQPQTNYVVVSVSQIQHRWTAVLGSQGQLYNVVVGDILTPDGAKVIGIDRYGVTLDRQGSKQRISLVSLI